VEQIAARHGIEQAPEFQASPLYPVVTRGELVRYQLVDSVGPGIPLLRELREQGLTEYVALPVTFSSGLHQAVTFATDRRNGFHDEEIASLSTLLPLVSLIFELHASQFNDQDHLAQRLSRAKRGYAGPRRERVPR
jgi:adenylate cyclase